MRRSEKLFFVFSLIIFIPTFIFAFKSYKSIGDKRDTLLLKERLQIENLLSQISAKTEEELLKREAIESKRPYYEYSYYSASEDPSTGGYVLKQSPLSQVPEDKLLMGYFQIDNAKRLTTPYFTLDEELNEELPEAEYKKQFLTLVDNKAYASLSKELDAIEEINPFKIRSQSHLVQLSYNSIKDIYKNIDSGGAKVIAFNKMDINSKYTKRKKRDIGELFEVVKYYPIRYLYKKGGVFAFRKVIVKQKAYVQGYMINILYLIDNILRKFIARNTPSNFSIYPYTIDGKTPFASAGISNKLSFIKLYVYKNDNSYVDDIIKADTIKYYTSTFSLFSLIFVGCAFIYRTIRSEAEVNQKKGDFISAVTHELKTPLTSIRLYSEMLLDDMVADEQKKKVYYRYMLKESERLTRLINNVLDFSRLESNKKEFKMEAGDLKELILELCEKYENNLKVSGFLFTYDIKDVRETVFDKDTITQVFINLMDNAVKYSTDSDEKDIRVRLYEQADRVVFEISDKGIGIPRNEQKLIFNKFYRVENELTRRSKGSGIGLSIVKEYIKAHKGTIEVASKEREGSTFKVALPCT